MRLWKVNLAWMLLCALLVSGGAVAATLDSSAPRQDTILHIRDDFSVPESLNSYEFIHGAGTLTIMDGALAPTDLSIKRVNWTAHRQNWVDVSTKFEYTTGSTVAGETSASTIVRYVDEANYLRAESRRDFLNIYKRQSGIATLLIQVRHPKTLPNQRYEWSFSANGDQLHAEHTIAGGTPVTADYTMTPPDAALFASGYVGIRMLPGDLNYRYHKFEIESLDGSP